MFPLPNKIDLVRIPDNHIVEAQVVRLTRRVAKTKIDATWWQDLGASTETRKNLLSFHDERTVSFYTKRGFKIVGEEEGLDQMELSPTRAFEWLKDEGYEI